MTGERLVATYRVRASADTIDARAEAIALEQSVELPRDAVHDARVREQVVGRVQAIRPVPWSDDAQSWFDVDIALAAETVGRDPGQLLNMLFGNTSLQDDVALRDLKLPAALVGEFPGPRFGIDGVRDLACIHGRPLSCTALKPQGLDPAALAALAGCFARAGLDVIKDDHGIADQRAAPFAARVAACQRAVTEANAARGSTALYAPSVTGSFDEMRVQIDTAHAAGIRMVLVAPMVSGVSNLAALARNCGMALLAHPTFAGATRIAPTVLLGSLFRLFGADAVIFPNAGGRFGYSQGDCATLAQSLRRPWCDLRPALPVPAGGMSLDRVPEMRERYGDDAMYLIGGNLLRDRDDVESSASRFAAAVRQRYAR